MTWKLCLPGLLALDLDDSGSGLLGLGQSKHQQTILEDRLSLIRVHGHIERQRARERAIEPLLEQIVDVLQRRPQLAPDGQGITLDDNIYLKKKTTPLRTPQGRQQNNSQRIRGFRHRATDRCQPPTADR